jgi:hypothetical protein
MGTKKITPPALAKEYGIDPSKVLTWNRNGELRAFDSATRVGGGPRFLIDREDVAAFELRRTVVPTVPVTRRQRRAAALGTTEFFGKNGEVLRRLWEAMADPNGSRVVFWQGVRAGVCDTHESLSWLVCAVYNPNGQTPRLT